MKKLSIVISILIVSVTTINAQLEDINPEYLKTLQERSKNIVDGMQLLDNEKAARVEEIIVIHYYQLSKIHDARDNDLKAISHLEGEEKEAAKESIATDTDAKLYKLHAVFLASLSAELSQAEVEMVKDGMTYGVVKHTFTGYLNLLPDLNDEQKRYIYKNLVEAREFAMDAGSSKAKHAWFGKYKGRINNYLSAQGIDMKKAEEELKQRQAEKKD